VRGKWSYLLLLPALLFIIFFLVVPILLTMVSTVQVDNGWTLSGYTNFFKDYYLRDIYFRTLKIAGITTILAAFLGFPTSYFISRSAKKYRGIFLVLAVFPLLGLLLVAEERLRFCLGSVPTSMLRREKGKKRYRPKSGACLTECLAIA